jgi:hypothetical protein
VVRWAGDCALQSLIASLLFWCGCCQPSVRPLLHSTAAPYAESVHMRYVHATTRYDCFSMRACFQGTNVVGSD